MEIQVFKQVASLLFLHPLSIFGARSVSGWELPNKPQVSRGNKPWSFSLLFSVFVAFPPGWSRLQDLHVHWLSEFTWIDRKKKVKKIIPQSIQETQNPCHAAKCLFCCITLCPSRDCARRHFGTAESWKRLFQHVDRSIQELSVSNQATNLRILLKDLTVKVC